MTFEQFCYWLQGRAELDPAPPTLEQWQAIRDHLALVFNKVTPQRGGLDKVGPNHQIPLQPPTVWPYDWYDHQRQLQPLRAECIC